jgi:hypothetical protein
MGYSDSAATQDTARALLTLSSQMERREMRMQASIQQQMQALREELAQMHHRVEQVMSNAGARIAQEAHQAVVPVTTEFDRAVAASSARLQGANKTVWMWFGAAGGTLLLVMLTSWAVLGYCRRELAEVQAEYQRYDNAAKITRAFYASDATLCADRLCVNVDSNARRQGDKRQYRPVRPRPQQ